MLLIFPTAVHNTKTADHFCVSAELKAFPEIPPADDPGHSQIRTSSRCGRSNPLTFIVLENLQNLFNIVHIESNMPVFVCTGFAQSRRCTAHQKHLKNSIPVSHHNQMVVFVRLEYSAGLFEAESSIKIQAFFFLHDQSYMVDSVYLISPLYMFSSSGNIRFASLCAF